VDKKKGGIDDDGRLSEGGGGDGFDKMPKKQKGTNPSSSRGERRPNQLMMRLGCLRKEMKEPK
jgi:hypothetical protein